MPEQPVYRTQVLDHLGLVTGMFDELGLGDVIDRATQQNPAMRDLTAGEAVKAMGLNGLGFVNHALYLVPKFFYNKPTARLVSPRVTPAQLNDDALGRALDTLYQYGVTELSSLMAATAAKRLGLGPRMAHLDTTSFHVDGRSNSDEEPAAKVVHLTRGYSRAHRPDLNQVMLALIVEHQAGLPLLLQPLHGNSHDGHAFGQVVKNHIAQLHTTYGTTYVVADSALYTADNLQQLTDTQLKWVTRVPATLCEVPVALAQAEPRTMTPLTSGYRCQDLTSTYGGVAQCWILVHSEPRHAQAQRTVHKQLLKHGQRDVATWQKLAGGPLPAKRMPSKPWPRVARAYRRPSSTRARYGPSPGMGSVDAPAKTTSPHTSPT